eukprot:1243719-Rhodomonas_salina.1
MESHHRGRGNRRVAGREGEGRESQKQSTHVMPPKRMPRPPRNAMGGEQKLRNHRQQNSSNFCEIRDFVHRRYEVEHGAEDEEK